MAKPKRIVKEAAGIASGRADREKSAFSQAVEIAMAAAAEEAASKGWDADKTREHMLKARALVRQAADEMAAERAAEIEAEARKPSK